MRYQKLGITLTLIITLNLSGGLSQSRPSNGNHNNNGSPRTNLQNTTESLYTTWLKKGADIRALSQEEVWKFLARAFQYSSIPSEENFEIFKNLLAVLPHDEYEKVFTDEVINKTLENSCQAAQTEQLNKLLEKTRMYYLEKFKLLITTLVHNHNTALIQKIETALKALENNLRQKIDLYKKKNMPAMFDIFTTTLRNFYRTKSVINQAIKQAQQEEKELQQKTKIFMTRSKGDTGFSFE